MSEPIRAQVAEILNSRELVLNRGAADGVKEGMRFAVLNRKGADIRDPETGDSLGVVEVEKTIVKVVRLAGEHMSVARTFRTYRTGSAGLMPSWLDIMQDTRRDIPETLRTDEDTYVAELDEKDSYVKRGDVAVQIVGEQYLGSDRVTGE